MRLDHNVANIEFASYRTSSVKASLVMPVTLFSADAAVDFLHVTVAW